MKKVISKTSSIPVMVLICIFALAFEWSWGPLGWTVASKMFPIELRSAGQSVAVAVNILLTLLVTESFLPLLCPLRFGLGHPFYAGWITALTVFFYLFLHETKRCAF
ncbi:Sugar/inositol transporter [Parasponia andersonii]|uniref:Sugar/inositol transporter n=1 Tax=Parasponia andersonii TaxID=3476 RepID=A0A2P5D1D2_PARAD|nr:Sugar/inositol transporter [Parasponia andersonii]